MTSYDPVRETQAKKGEIKGVGMGVVWGVFFCKEKKREGVLQMFKGSKNAEKMTVAMP